MTTQFDARILMMPLVRDLPLFPLDLVLYPDQTLQMYIVEEPYREMVERCIDRKEPFGVVYSREGKIAQIGSLAWIRQVVSRYESGMINVFVRGGDRFQVVDVYHNHPYLTADVETIQEADEVPNNADKERAITQHMRFLELSGKQVRPGIYQNQKYVSFVLATDAGLTVEQMQQVLEMQSENGRLSFLTGHFETVLPQVQEVEATRRKVQSNGHFDEETGEEGSGEEERERE